MVSCGIEHANGWREGGREGGRKEVSRVELMMPMGGSEGGREGW